MGLRVRVLSALSHFRGRGPGADTEKDSRPLFLPNYLTDLVRKLQAIAEETWREQIAKLA